MRDMSKGASVLMLLLGLLPVTLAAQRGAVRSLLEVELAIANGDDERFREWALDRPAASFDSVTEVKPDQLVTAQARVRGCLPGPSGRCDATVQYVITGPDGQTFREEAARPVEEGKPAPALRFTPARTDQAGLYKVVVVVRDAHARRIVRTERIFGLRID